MVAALAFALVLFVSMVSSAVATEVAVLQPHKSGINTIPTKQVKACSKKHSGRCVNGPVKSYELGQKVRLPGGTWVDCAGDCKDKLRAKTVDFWYEQKLRN